MMRPLRVGTDYSGIETPLMALQALHVPYRHLFSSEICHKVRSVIEARFSPEVLFEDALKRPVSALPKKLDLYVAGFPCQVFSKLNKLTGNHSNPQNPLRHFYGCLRTIVACKPKVFVLENVPSLVTINNGKPFAKIMKRLEELADYNVTCMILNARNYGSPQNRKRLFIVAFRGRIRKGIVLPPPEVAKEATFASIFEKNAKRRRISAHKQTMLDHCAAQYSHHVFIAPRIVNMRCQGSLYPTCLTRSGEGIYSSKHRSLSTLREDMRLQGIPDSFSFPDHISDTTGREIVGNVMCVDVLIHLFRQVLKSLHST